MPGRSAYPDKGSMRVHASLRDNVRLWFWAAGATMLLFAVIVVLGIGASPFPSVSIGHRHSSRTVLLPDREAAAAVYPRGPATYAARAAVPAGKRNDATRSSGRGRVATQPDHGTPTNRAAPTPDPPTPTPDTKPTSSTPPASAAPSAASSGATVSVAIPTTPAPLPSLPTVTTPPVDVPAVAVPSVSLP